MADIATIEKTSDDTALIERMTSVGAQYGYRKSRRHPSVTPYVFGMKNRTEMFDVGSIAILLEKAKEYVKDLAREGKTLLFVGGKPESWVVMRQGAETLEMPYSGARWIGGTITNFDEIKIRINRLIELKQGREKGEHEKYTKFEQLNLTREMTRLEERFGGLVSMTEKLPDALFIVDPRHEHTAAKEAKDAGIPVVALLNSDCDANAVQYPIVANDAARASITFFVNEIVSAYKEGSEERASMKAKKVEA
jgi:small subunit ribosomal protein S2